MHCEQRSAAALPTWMHRSDAFALLDQIVAGTDQALADDGDRHPGAGSGAARRDYRRLARDAGLPAVLVIMNTAAALCRERNRQRDRPVPAPVLTEQLRKISKLVESAPRMRAGTRSLIIDQQDAAAHPARRSRLSIMIMARARLTAGRAPGVAVSLGDEDPARLAPGRWR